MISDEMMYKFLDRAYPVGSVYINANDSRSPNIIMGFGQWEAWGVGRAIVGIDTTQTEFASAEQTGGHKLMQSHTHTLSFKGGRTAIASYGDDKWAMGGTVLAGTYSIGGIGNTGGGNSENLQPYQVGYVWKRIA